VLPVGSVDDANLDIEIVRRAEEHGNQVLGIPVASVSSSGSGSPSVWETSNTEVGLNPTSPFDHSSGGVSSYSQSLCSW